MRANSSFCWRSGHAEVTSGSRCSSQSTSSPELSPDFVTSQLLEKVRPEVRCEKMCAYSERSTVTHLNTTQLLHSSIKPNSNSLPPLQFYILPILVYSHNSKASFVPDSVWQKESIQCVPAIAASVVSTQNKVDLLKCSVIFTLSQSVKPTSSLQNQLNLSQPNPAAVSEYQATDFKPCFAIFVRSNRVCHLALSNINVSCMIGEGNRITTLTCLNPLPFSQLPSRSPAATGKWAWQQSQLYRSVHL